ncbi:MAG: transposase DNA-binding-containing protein [Crocosphaera sp.]|nr:transposase DNA-binding-containing protein [Crocosphaera sp.]
MKEWVSEELKYLDLGDKRLNTRLGKIVSELWEHPPVLLYLWLLQP